MLLVTGASGFIGKHVVKKACDEGYDVAVVTRKPDYSCVADEKVIVGDLSNPEHIFLKCKDYNISKCIHLAWEGIPDYSFTNSKKSIDDSFNLLELIEKMGVKQIVTTGSCWEYFEPKGSIRTEYQLDYGNFFKAAKHSVRMMQHAFCCIHNIRSNWLRLFYVYGPGQRKESLIPYIISETRNKCELHLKGAFNKNDFVYVTDVADAILRVLGGEYPETLNVGTGESIRILDIAKEIAFSLDAQLNEEVFTPNGSEVDFYADKDEMMNSYGWEAKVSIKEGISRMLKEKDR